MGVGWLGWWWGECERAALVGAAVSGWCPAVSYSPTWSPTQYHRRWRA